ncbi:hypothetical protein J6S88_07280 [bacterium]|nr:hypothetical protein [bacterium]
MIISGLARKTMLIHLKYDANARLMRILDQLRGLARYASNIADGLISMREAHDIPTDLFCRQMQFTSQANAFAYNTAMQQMNYMMPMMQANLQTMPPEMQQQYLNNQFMMLYQEGRRQAALEEQRVLHRQEEELKVEQESIKQEIAMYDEEIKSLDQASKDDLHSFFSRA